MTRVEDLVARGLGEGGREGKMARRLGAVPGSPHLSLPYQGRLIPRPRLRDLLPPLAEGGVVTVVAGPGYGKTSFVADAVNAAGVPAAYFALTEQDRDPAQFLRSLAAALGAAHQDLGEAAVERLRECRDVEQEVLSVTAELLQEMAAVSGATYLVLDDLAEIESSPAVVASLCFLAESLPAGWTLFLVSRRSIPCDLEPLRMQGRVVDIGLRRLRFTPSEIGDWARRKWGLDLGLKETRLLWRVTEGWPVALALLNERYRHKERVSVKEDVVRLVGKGEKLRDYLALQVFELLDPRAVEVLLMACLFPRVVFPRDESYFPGHPGRAEAVLTDLVENGLLVTETGSRTFTLHPLLRAYARRRMGGLGRGQAERIVLRAGRHLEAVGELLPAVSLYLETGQVEEALRPLRVHVSRHLNAATTFACREWLALVPESIAREDPWLLLVRARVLQDEGQHREAEATYQRADRQFAAQGDREGRLRALLGRCFCLFLCGRWDDALKAAEDAEAVAGSRDERAEVIATKGNILLGLCRWDEAVELFEIALATASAEARPALEERVFLYRARLFFLRGKYDMAADWAMRAVRRAGAGPRTTYAAALNTVATLRYLQAEYDEARLHAESALGLVRARGYAYLEAPVLLSLAGVAVGERDFRTALTYIKAARDLSRDCGDAEAEVWALDMQADLCRRNRNAEKALELHLQALAVVEEHQLAEFERLRLRCGVGMDQAVLGRETESLECLEQVLAGSRAHRLGALTDMALFYLGWLLARRCEERRAAQALRESLSLSKKNGRLHFLLQEASVVTPVLALAVRLTDEAEVEEFVEREIVARLPARLRDYYARLAWGDVYPTDVPLGPPRSSRRGLAARRVPKSSPDEQELIARMMELTDREMEILRLIGSGLPNKVIAAKLFITEKTIKTHANRVYRKLGVANRLQAVLALQEFDRLVELGCVSAEAKK